MSFACVRLEIFNGDAANAMRRGAVYIRGNAYLAWITGVMIQQASDSIVGMERGISSLFFFKNAKRHATGIQKQ